MHVEFQLALDIPGEELATEIFHSLTELCRDSMTHDGKETILAKRPAQARRHRLGVESWCSQRRNIDQR
jgi:hypothetical protein